MIEFNITVVVKLFSIDRLKWAKLKQGCNPVLGTSDLYIIEVL